jgi:hypothetical protein
MKVTASWDVAPCSLKVNIHFRGVYCLPLSRCPGDGDRLCEPLKHWSVSTRLHGATSYKAVIFTVTASPTLSLWTVGVALLSGLFVG